jgi:CubicO group peptidase (beta-lactamase class C family)
MLKLTLSALFGFTGLLSQPTSAQAAPTPHSAAAKSADARIPELLKKHGAAGIAVGVIRNRKLVWTGYYGQQGPGVPVTANSLFNVASLAKPVTAEAILRLASAGKLSLDEPMARHWVDPDLAGDPRLEKLTARVALSHRTGFPNWRRSDPDKKLRFGSEPGTKASYSGEGYDYLARFAEKATGKGFEELVQILVFEPIGIRSAALSRRDWMKGRITTPMDAKGAWGSSNLREAGQWTAADDLFVTLADYAAFMIAVSRGDGLSPAVAAQRTKMHTPTEGCGSAKRQTCPTATGFGLGWELLTFSGRQMLWHTGGDWAESTMSYIYPDTGDGALIFINGASGKPVLLDVLDAIEDPTPIRHEMRAYHEEQAAAKK